MKIGNFLSDESGAVTVDWTVLAAAIVGLGIATVAAVRTGVVDLGDDGGVSNLVEILWRRSPSMGIWA